MKITAYSAAISSLLTTPSGQLGMGSRHPDIEIDQAYMFEAKFSGDINLNILNGVGSADGAEELLGGNGEDINGEEISLTQVAQIHIRNTGDTVILATMDYNDEADTLNVFPIQAGGEIAIFSQQFVSSCSLDLVARDVEETISAKVFVTGKQ